MTYTPAESVVPVLGEMDPKDRMLVTKFYGLDGEREHTLVEIAAILVSDWGYDRTLTRQRVHQMKDRAVARAASLVFRKAS